MSRFLRQLALIFLLCAPQLVAACKQQLPMTTAIMRYEDFGPPSMVYELIGFDWWQWLPHGDSDPNKHYDIRVVVYRNASLAEVRRKYPINPEALQDYRYVAYEDAIKHLDQQISDDVMPTLTERLRATRKELEARFVGASDSARSAGDTR